MSSEKTYGIGRPGQEIQQQTGFDVFENFRYNIVVLRASKNITAKQLSVKLGFTEGRIGNFESKTLHNPTVLELSCIASYFHVSMDDLIHNKIKVMF